MESQESLLHPNRHHGRTALHRIFLYRFDTADWVTGMGIRPVTDLVQTIAKGSSEDIRETGPNMEK